MKRITNYCSLDIRVISILYVSNISRICVSCSAKQYRAHNSWFTCFFFLFNNHIQDLCILYCKSVQSTQILVHLFFLLYNEYIQDFCVLYRKTVQGTQLLVHLFFKIYIMIISKMCVSCTAKLYKAHKSW